MKRRKISVTLLIFLTYVILGTPIVHAQKEHHGADSSFEKEGMVVLWAILKGKDEDSSWVYLKILNATGGKGNFSIFSVEAVDPFSNEKGWVVRGQRLGKENLVKSNRSSFTDKTVRRILFFSTQRSFEEGEPDMIIFYRGVPDTTPELLSEKELETYFEQALGRLKKR